MSLRHSIEDLLYTRQMTPLADGYRVARRSFYMDRWIRGGGWYPDYQLRLLRQSARALARALTYTNL